MNDTQTADTITAAFIARWEPSGGKELANYQSFLIDLCSLLGVAQPSLTCWHPRRLFFCNNTIEARLINKHINTQV